MTFLIVVITTNVYSQVGVTVYSIHAVGINTNKDKTVSGEAKFFFNRAIENTVAELSGMYKFSERTHHRLSAGLGVFIYPFAGFDFIGGITIPVQLEIFPLHNFRQLSLVLELAPEIDVEGDNINVRQLWGFRYTF